MLYIAFPMVVQYYYCRHNYKVSGLWLPSIVVATTMYMYVRWVEPLNFGVHMHSAGVAYMHYTTHTRGSYMLFSLLPLFVYFLALLCHLHFSIATFYTSYFFSFFFVLWMWNIEIVVGGVVSNAWCIASKLMTCWAMVQFSLLWDTDRSWSS